MVNIPGEYGIKPFNLSGSGNNMSGTMGCHVAMDPAVSSNLSLSSGIFQTVTFNYHRP